MRKGNIIFGTIAVILLLWHSTVMSLLLLGKIAYNPNNKLTGWALLGVIILHALFNVVMWIKGRSKRKVNMYIGLNKSCMLQRFTGILILMIFGLHYFAYGYTTSAGEFIPTTPSLHVYLGELLFLSVAVIHLFLSLNRLSVSIGIGVNKNARRVTQVISGVVCIGLFCFVTLAQTGYFFA